jgi:quercetin dioxygenase-like cupin family protein
MRYALVIVLALLGISCAGNGGETAMEGKSAARGHGSHQVTRPEQIQWQPANALPPGAQMAVLEGDLESKGYFAVRVRFPDGYRVPPHYHPGVERVTVLSGTLNLGTGEKFDQSSAQKLTPGTYTSMAAGMRHYAWATGSTEIQVTSIGPWGITYVNPAEDPRRNAR